MAEVKANRTKKKQLGQFMTPISRCESILKCYEFTKEDKVLEPSFGCGNFILTIIDKFINLYSGDIEEKLDIILTENIWGVEFDTVQYNMCLENIKNKYGYLPKSHNLKHMDYFLYDINLDFDWIIGNPPFGGTLNPEYQDVFEKKWGFRMGEKIKKETYSFFIIKSIESLKENGKLIFISSDTFLTIKTMKGLRIFLFDSGFNKIDKIDNFSEETDYPMIVLTHQKNKNDDHILINGNKILHINMISTDNFSWNIDNRFVRYFTGDKLSKYLTGTSGMTIGKNELFVKEIRPDNTITEEYEYKFYEDNITLEKELSKAKNGKISNNKINEIKKQESDGIKRRNVFITKRSEPLVINLPHEDYYFYNKANNNTIYSNPKWVVFWKDKGDAVITFKKNGPWYLHGVGGMPFFYREGITWQLISSSIKAKYLPAGYVLDSGSPMAVLKDNIDKKELFFILGWLLTNKCNEILKNVINHTKNIQSKDIERLPYPFWVSDYNKSKIIDLVNNNIRLKTNTGKIDDKFNETIESLFRM